MAKDGNTRQPVINKSYKGLFLDANPMEQPEGTYRFALNAVNQTNRGDMHMLSTEESNVAYKGIDIYGGTVIGSIYIDDNEHILFVVGKREEYSSIYLLTGYGELTKVLHEGSSHGGSDTSCLNFSINTQIKGEYRLRNGCEKTVYWSDGENSIKTLNLTEAINGNYYDESGYIICEKLKLVKTSEIIPVFVSATVGVGGMLKSGTYNFAIQFMDENLNETAWLTTSMTIPIYVAILGGDYDGILGSSNAVEGEASSVDEAAFGSEPSNKVIRLEFDNLDTNYAYYRVAVIEAISGTGLPTRTLLSEKIPITTTSFIHDGNEEKYTEIATEDVILDTPQIGTANHLEQVEDRLLFANTKSIERDYCSMQAFASAITAEYIVDNIGAYDYTEVGNGKNPNTYFEKIGYMGGEVYAYGIVYEFDDGTEAPFACHIPGRPAATTTQTGRAQNDRYTFSTYNDDIQHLVENSYTTEGEALTGNDLNTIEFWRVYDTSHAPVDQKGLMAFWEMQSGTYIDRTDCDGDPANYWGSDGYSWSEQPLAGQPIRHHKFPNRTTVPHVTIGSYGNYKTEIIIDVKISDRDSGTAADFWVDLKYTDSGGAQTERILFNDNGSSSRANWSWRKVYTDELTNIVLDCGGTGTSGYTNLVNTDIVTPVQDGETRDYYKTVNGALQYDVNYCNLSSLHLLTTKLTTSIAQESSGEVLSLLGIKFSNIQLPPGVRSYKIVRAKRDNFNRTVLGKAFSGNTRQSNNYLGYHSFADYNSLPPGYNLATNINNKYIISPENLFSLKDLSPQYIKWENRFYPDSIPTAFGTGVIQDVGGDDGGWFDNDKYDWEGLIRVSRVTIVSSGSEPERNLKVENQLNMIANSRAEGVNIAPSQDTPTTKTVWNCAHDSAISIMKISKTHRSDGTQYPIDDDADYKKHNIHYVSLISERDIHPILDNIKYYQCHNNTYDTASVSVYGGDTFISHFYQTATLQQSPEKVARVWEFITRAVMSVVIIAASVVLSIASWGALSAPAALGATLALAALSMGTTAQMVSHSINAFSNEMANPEFQEFVRSMFINRGNYRDDMFFTSMYHTRGMWIESDINVGLREAGEFGYRGVLTNGSTPNLQSYLITKVMNYNQGEGRYEYGYAVKPEIYRYNLDFSRQNEEKVHFALSSTFDCCSACFESFPNRIFYSEKSFLEEKFDSYGKILPMNYITVPGESGEITNIFSISNALYAHTKSNLWYIPQNIQERITGDIVSLVGTGSFFDSTPRRVFNDDIGAAGSTQKLATLQTKHGVFFIDSREGMPYLLNFSNKTGTQIQSLVEENGMKKWFRENGRFLLYDQVYELEGVKIPISNPSNLDNGIGFIAAYDYQNDRILLSKRDYKILEGGEERVQSFTAVNDPSMRDGEKVSPTDDINDNALAYNEDDGKFYVFDNDTAYEQSINDPEVFENKSFTISYSFSTGAWMSFHSYLPSFYIYDYKNLYSIDGNKTFDDFILGEKNIIWKHNNAERYLNFYEEYKPFIIDFILVNNPLDTSLFEEFMFITEADKALSCDFSEHRYITFNKVIVYNTRQSTGLMEMPAIDDNPDADLMSRSIINTAGVLPVRKRDRVWLLNGFKDMRIRYDVSVFTTLWREIESSYPIDKISNDSSVSTSKDWTQQETFRDRYLGVRLIYENEDNVRLTSNYNIGIKKQIDA